MKRKAALVLGIALMATTVLAFTGCNKSSGMPDPNRSEVVIEEASESEATSEELSEEQAGMANPWHDAADADEAAKGAGINFFSFEEGMMLTVGSTDYCNYRYMEGIVELEMPVGATSIIIRKGLNDMATDGDISGDYNEYAYNWEQNIKGLVVKCYGNREGEAMKVIWQLEDYSYSIIGRGEGGDGDWGLNADDINSIINGLQ